MAGIHSTDREYTPPPQTTPNPWTCPFADCDFEGTGAHRAKHLLDEHD